MLACRSTPATGLLSSMVAFGTSFLAFAQEIPSLPLRVKERVVIAGLPAGPFDMPLRCDAKGNVYIRPYQVPDTLAAPILRINQQGRTTATFSIRSVKGYERGLANEYALGLRGEVYFLAVKRGPDPKAPPELTYVKLDGEGKFVSEMKPEPAFFRAGFAVFPGGNFLLTGMKLSPEGKPTDEPFTAIYDPAGRLVREITPAGDELSKATGQDETERKKRQEQVRNSVALGVSVPADDGNIYLFRPSNPPAVFVISPTGEVLRRLSIPAPSEEFEPWDLKVSGGRILVFFQEKLKSGVNPRQLFTVVDSATGERLFHYAAPPEIGSGLACYTPDGFTFVNGEGRQLVLLHVTTK